MLLDPNRSDDAAFDTIYPLAIRLFSRRFWTPVAVARRAAELFRGSGAKHVLDIGAGAGKFTLVAATAAPELEFTGIEQRVHLVAVARDARAHLRIPNAHFWAGDATVASWDAFDGLYFFNPLAENLFAEQDRIDDRVELTEAKWVRDTIGIERALRKARLGTMVVTYHGASVKMPGSFALEHSERAGTDWLRFWKKTAAADDGALFVDINDGIASPCAERRLARYGT